jgi:hypothetical protein
MAARRGRCQQVQPETGAVDDAAAEPEAAGLRGICWEASTVSRSAGAFAAGSAAATEEYWTPDTQLMTLRFTNASRERGGAVWSHAD